MIPTHFDVTIRATLKSFDPKTKEEWNKILEEHLWKCGDLRDVLMFRVQFSLNLDSYEPDADGNEDV